MSETTTPDSTPRTGSLTALRLPQLQEMAAGMGIKGYRRLRKGELIDAINSAGAPSAPVTTDSASAETSEAGRGRRPARAGCIIRS